MFRSTCRQPALKFIFVSLALDLVSTGLVIPVLPRLILNFAGNEFSSAAEIFGVLLSLWALLQFIASPILGAMSDRFGRRPLVLVSNLAQVADHLIMATSSALPPLFVGKILSGATFSTVPMAYAYIADTTSPDRRAGAYATLNVAFGLMFLLGPMFGGFLGHVDIRLPFFAAAGLGLANFIYGLLVLPESLATELRRPLSWATANPIASLKLLLRSKQLMRLGILSFILQAAQQALSVCSVLYMTYRYQWDESQVGLALAGVGLAYIFIQSILMRPLCQRLPEKTIAIIGFIMGAIGFLTYGAASTGTLYLIGIPIMELWSLAQPSIYALMTKEVSGDEQGRLQGANSSLLGIANLSAPWLFAKLFATAIDPNTGLALPGLPFYVAALFMVAGIIVVTRLKGPMRITQVNF